MRKIRKSRRGFTLIEMVLVIAIIIILAAILILGITGYMNRAHNAADSLSIRNSTIDFLTDEIDHGI